MKIHSSISALVGHTPLVRINRLAPAGGAEVVAKLEFFNPSHSVKDRAALAMVDAAEKSGVLKPGITLVEPTSGNTGISLAMIAAERGYRCILTMPETMSKERRALLRGYARDIGLAFQIVDDLLDTEGDEAAAGKALRKDAEAGKQTFVSLLGADRARAQAHMLVGQAVHYLGSHGEEAELLRAIARFIVERDR